MHDEPMASDAAEFWDRRHAVVPSSTGGLAPDADRRLVLLADVSDPAVVSRYERLRSRLEEFACLCPMRPDSLHVTVKLLEGDFARSGSGPSPTAGGDASARGRRGMAVTIAEAISRFEPFEVTFPRFNLFPDVVYAEVDDGGRLAELNRALCRLPATTTLKRDGENFIPHLTLGYLTASEDYHDLVEFLERNRELSFPPLLVDRLHLVSYGTTDEGRPTYESLRTFDLRS
jgi:2'-5' RNA ligase